MTTGSFLHNFSSVYWIFTKLDHMIPLWKGKNPIYFGVIRSKGKVTYYKYNFWQRSFPQDNFSSVFPCGRGRTLFILGSLPLYRLIIYIDGCILWCTHFLFLCKIRYSVSVNIKNRCSIYRLEVKSTCILLIFKLQISSHWHWGRNVDLNIEYHVYVQSSKWKFEFTGPNQILEFIIIYRYI